MSNNQNQQTFTEKALELIQKHTIGGIKDGNTAFEDAWEIGFSNLSKITAQFAFEYDLQHFGNYEKFSRFKDKLFDFSQLQTIAIHADRAKTHLDVLRNSSFTQHQEFKIIEQRLINTVSELNKGILEISNKNGLNINVDSDNLSTILDKAYGNGYSQNFLKGLNKIFDYNQYIKLVYDTFNKDFKEVGDKSDYLQNLLGVIPKLAGSAFIDGKAGFVLGGEMSITKLATQSFISHLEVVEKWASKLPTLSAKDFMGSLSRGLLVGILTDVTYKLSYVGAEKLLWGWLFEEMYGETAYEIYADEFDALYSTIFQHLTADKLNAVIAFNTMLLGNFVNAQGKSVILEDTVTLFGSDDYQEMNFDKALKYYKAIHKLISGKNDSDGITDEFSMIKHMEKSYEAFKQLRGQKLIIAQHNDGVIETFKNKALSDKPDAQAYRYALVNFNPFVLLGADYSQHNQNGNLDLYSNDNLNGLTTVYLEKRADMLSAWFKDSFDSFYAPNNTFVDLALDIRLDKPKIDYSSGNNGIRKHQSEIIFGGDKDDIIKAKDIGNNINYLFGGAGNDTLDGGAGNDYMEGGQDFDTYHIADRDTLFDSDGKGQILFNGKALPTDFILKDNTSQNTSNIWYAKDSTGNVLYTAIQTDNDLSIYQANSSPTNFSTSNTNQVTIKDFFNIATQRGTTHSALGITLGNSQEDIDKYRTYTIKADDNYFSTIYTAGFPANYLDIIGSNKGDSILGMGNKQLNIDAGAGNDLIIGGDLADIIKGGEGNDLIYGSPAYYGNKDPNDSTIPKQDHDRLIGGSGNDLIYGGIGNDIIWVDNDYQLGKTLSADKDPTNPNNAHHNNKGDWAVGGRGNDVIHGGVNKDFLQGGADSDAIYGGGGDDVILGDDVFNLHFRISNKMLNNNKIKHYHN